MAKHALLSASGSDRWFKCPPSALLEAEIEEKSSEYARRAPLPMPWQS